MNTDQHRQRRFAVTYDLTQRAQRGAESAEKTIEKAAARALRRHAHSRVNAASQPFLAGSCFSASSARSSSPRHSPPKGPARRNSSSVSGAAFGGTSASNTALSRSVLTSTCVTRSVRSAGATPGSEVVCTRMVEGRPPAKFEYSIVSDPRRAAPMRHWPSSCRRKSVESPASIAAQPFSNARPAAG